MLRPTPMRLRRVRAVVLREWTETVRNRTFLGISLLVPGVMVGMMVLPSYLVRRRGGELPSADVFLANRFLAASLLVVFLFLGITSQAQALLRSVLEERGNRMVEVMLSSVGPLEILVGKILGYAAVAMTQLLVWIIAATVLARAVGLPLSLRLLVAAGWRTAVLFLACYLVGYLLYASLYATVGAVIGGEREAVLYQQLLGLVLIAPFVVTMTLATRPTDPLATTLTWIPIMAPTMLVLRSAFVPLSLVEIAAALGLATLTALCALLLAARLFKGATLLSARRLSWREAWRLAGRER